MADTKQKSSPIVAAFTNTTYRTIFWYVWFAGWLTYFVISYFIMENPNRVIWHVTNSFQLAPFGLLVASGILFSILEVQKFCEKTGLDWAFASDAIFYLLVGGFIGAHVLDSLFYYPDNFWEALSNWRTNYSSLGGMMSGAVSTFVYCKIKKKKLINYADALVVAVVAAWMFGRLGCFTAHDHPGPETTSFFGVAVNTASGVVKQHDLGFYEMVYLFIIHIVLIALLKKPRFKGFVVAFVTIGYPPIRFTLDFFRNSEEQRYLKSLIHIGEHAGLTPAHFMSIGFFLLGLTFFFLFRKNEPFAYKDV